jgi:hypothetical protein
MNVSTGTDAITVLCDGTIRAAILILRDRGIDTATVDADKLSADLRAELKSRVAEIMGEWEDALAAHMGEDFIRHMMNVQCNHVALKALQAGGWI